MVVPLPPAHHCHFYLLLNSRARQSTVLLDRARFIFQFNDSMVASQAPNSRDKNGRDAEKTRANVLGCANMVASRHKWLLTITNSA